MSWCTIESDPGVFTELISKFGVEGLQFQELYEMEAKSLAHLEPVFGLIFLFKWKSSQQEAPRAVVDDSNVFFAKQVINNACATQAILNVLLNRDDVKLGKKLEEFKSFAQCLPADMRYCAHFLYMPMFIVYFSVYIWLLIW